MAPVTSPEHERDLALARSGDGAAFERLVEPQRRALRAHCYRMLGSIHDADDAVQDALVRAWKGIDRFEGRSSLRSWLYTVATRVCLDAIDRRGRRALPMDLGPSSDHVVTDDVPLGEVAWLGPYPTTALADGRTDPDHAVESRESIELAFIAALQHLPPNQRAALLLFEVLGFSVAEISATMATTDASVNSALQRARRAVDERVPARTQQQTLAQLADGRLSAIVAGFASALERGDTAAMVALLTRDVTWSMPPMPTWYRGLDSVVAFVERVPFTCGDWRHVPTSANGQPAVGSYLRWEGSDTHLGWSIDVLTLESDRIAAVTSFVGARHFTELGLPLALDRPIPCTIDS